MKPSESLGAKILGYSFILYPNFCYLCSMEQWKQLKENPKYFISNLGRFKNIYGRILKQNVNQRGYYYCNISTNAIVTKVKIHRLVAKYYVVNPYNLETVNHIDGNKLNNNYINLEWLSIGDNVRHYYSNKYLNPDRNSIVI